MMNLCLRFVETNVMLVGSDMSDRPGLQPGESPCDSEEAVIKGDHPASAPTSPTSMSASTEQSRFREQVAALERWWRSPRFVRVKRPYDAEQVVSKRGTLPISYPSDTQAKKLFALLERHSKNGTPSHTYGA